MTNIYDMVSGVWLTEESCQVEEMALFSGPTMSTEKLVTLLTTPIEATSSYHTMPVDLTAVCISSFLNSQDSSN